MRLISRSAFTFVIILFIVFVSKAQQTTHRVFGSVIDSLKHPVANATVSIIKLSNQAGFRFTRTDTKGNFSITLPQGFNKDSFSLKVNCVGYEKYTKHDFLIDEKNIIQLTSSQNSLPDVVVKDNRPIVQKGDTLNYNAANFTGKSDRYLGDIIKKLPGVTVDENGKISYQGKPINNFYLGGDDLLGDKYNIATDNIPSKEVDKIQVIEHNQNVKMLNGIVPSDQAGINITFKNPNKFHFIDNAELEGGTPGKWNGTVHNMSFNEKFKAINEFKSNNEGLSYTRETGVSGLGSAPVGNSLFNKAEMLNLNDLYKFNKYKGLRINGYYLHDVQSTQTQSSTTYFLPGNDTVRYNEKDNNHLPIDAFNVQLNYNVNSQKAYFDNTLTFTQTKTTPYTNILTNGQNVLQNTDSKSTSFSNTLQGYVLIHKKHIINYNSVFQYSDNPQTLMVTPGALPENLNDGISYLNTFQHQHLPSYSTDNHLGYSHVFGHWMFGTNAGFNYQNQHFRSNVQLVQNDHSITEPQGFANGLHWQKAQVYFTPQLTFKSYSDQLNISAPFNFTHINYHNDSVANNADKLNHLFVNPTVSWQHKIGKENQFSLSYNFGQQAASISQVYGGQMLSGYRNYSSYQTPLLTGNAQTYDAGFDFKKTLLALFANVDVSYTRNVNYFLDSTSVQQNSTVIIAIPVHNASSNIALAANASKYIYALNTTLAIGANFGHGSSPLMQNGVLFNSHNNTSSYNASITPTIFDWLDMKFSGTYARSTSSSNAIDYPKQMSRQWNETSSIIFYPVKNLSIDFDNQFLNSFQRGQNPSSAFLMNSYVQYNFQGKKWRNLQLRLSCNNMANVRNYEIVNISSNVVNSYQYLLQPRMLLLSAHFDL
ncbi:hypothetical protein A9P82_00295 [Arachidicoccus ginsenosidimutans]|uniref:TonB-dependent receptor n=1 Tax=Arachidicoccus sp. BS20 TaxID=1850526 RepID=UPI0007F0EA39|nr:carboxypeptidase-like regulatory domain-containing protein [Arachidicoccus sp. BS20]ANI87896.1 hypothetical protein A9P82_00295 [Arachidicoccus sp. BS20]